ESAPEPPLSRSTSPDPEWPTTSSRGARRRRRGWEWTWGPCAPRTRTPADHSVRERARALRSGRLAPSHGGAYLMENLHQFQPEFPAPLVARTATSWKPRLSDFERVQVEPFRLVHVTAWPSTNTEAEVTPLASVMETLMVVGLETAAPGVGDKIVMSGVEF